MYRSLIAVAAGVIALGLTAQAQEISCFANTGVPPIVRAGGERERVGDILLICQGGNPTLPGTPLPLVDIRLTLDTVLTSRSLNTDPDGAVTEALLLIDEPASDAQRYCPAGSPANTCDDKNVFAARTVPGNRQSVVFHSIPFDPPGPYAVRFLRIVNLRAGGIEPPTGSFPVSFLYAALEVEGALGVSIMNPMSLTAFGFEPITWELRDAANPAIGLTGPVTLDGCRGNNVHLARKPDTKQYDDGRTFILRINENNVSTTPKTRAGDWPDADHPLTGPADQSIPGMVPFNESGFTNPNFPVTDQINTAGQATSGTRLIIRFDNVPPGVVLYTSLYELGKDATSSRIRRIETDSNGKGATTLSAATNPFEGGLRPLTVISPGVQQAVFEASVDSPFTIDSYDLPVVVAYDKNPSTSGTFHAKVYLGPIGDGTVATDSTVPLFRNRAAQVQVVNISRCAK